MSRPARRARPSAEEINGGVLDITAGLIARRGIKDTAVQAVADQAGYSKAGILARFASKELLVEAALAQCTAQTEAIRAAAAAAPAGETRDAAALVGIADLALARPGWAELALAAFTLRRGDDVGVRLEPVAATLLDVFGIDMADATATPLDRRARVSGAFGAIVMLALTYETEASATEASATEARPHMLQVGWDALGHDGPVPLGGVGQSRPGSSARPARTSAVRAATAGSASSRTAAPRTS
ncbi:MULTISPECIES: TetR/AcrR family transcriptional regulator [Curtobacterium]|uniref:TetR/AcrR family transcriptional regulator n=1 Tax=Curtobacterium TaxID=2034 RepID=UPI00265921DF|nr:helix-turn-helix domain-containing protein [Curtobacterium flaccumfaciens]MCS5504920.1 TetR/AcrR family transcriptional regulator [Curtobacterium flaccumfaciens pv. flaccumfaciens]